MFWQYVENIAYIIFCADIARLLHYFNNISDEFRNILSMLEYFSNISVLCEIFVFVNFMYAKCEATVFTFL